ncbi:hypothetical protein [Tunturiibacter psychrotolerans]|uniref:hypothetical protein n=1 Tax=Tunturiibacter psychrotolerans TaxID=3069686 RepID=UPI003D225E2A
MTEPKAGFISKQPRKTRTRRQWPWLVVLSTVGPVGFFLIGIFNLSSLRDSSRLYGMGAALDCLLALGLGLFLLRLIRRMSSVATEEDRARWSYGKTFGELTEMEKDRVKHQMRHELEAEGKVQDEREAAMQRDAEGHAYRLLRPGLPGLVLVWWAVGLFMPIGQARTGVLFSALASTGLVIVVLSLPELIRVWMMPNPLGEPHLVMGGPKV